MKECSKCKEVKKLSEFRKRPTRKIGLQSQCKKCQALNKRNYYKTKEGKLILIYGNQLKSSKRRGYEPPNYTSYEFINRFINDKDYLNIHSKWVDSGYLKDLSPSFDRKDDYKPYSFDNLNKWMTWKENNNKAFLDTKEGRLNKRSKAVKGTNVNTEKVIDFHSMQEAKRNGFCQTAIGRCCNGKQNYHKGYKWEYKND